MSCASLGSLEAKPGRNGGWPWPATAPKERAWRGWRGVGTPIGSTFSEARGKPESLLSKTISWFILRCGGHAQRDCRSHGLRRGVVSTAAGDVPRMRRRRPVSPSMRGTSPAAVETTGGRKPWPSAIDVGMPSASEEMNRKWVSIRGFCFPSGLEKVDPIGDPQLLPPTRQRFFRGRRRQGQPHSGLVCFKRPKARSRHPPFIRQQKSNPPV